MSDDKDAVVLTYEEAVALLPEGKEIHTFVNPAGILVGADWTRKEILKALKKHKVVVTGSQAQAMKHGMAFWDGSMHVFVETIGEPKK